METGQESAWLSQEERADLINDMISVIFDHYVVHDSVGKIADFFDKQVINHAYRDFSNAEKFAEQVTADLKNISNDKHLALIYDSSLVERTRHEISMYRGYKGSPDQKVAYQQYQDKLRRRNYGFQKIEILPGNIGYVKMTNFDRYPITKETALDAFRFLKNTDAWIIDLRKNSGGSERFMQFMCSFLLGEDNMLMYTKYPRNNSPLKITTFDNMEFKRPRNKEVYVLIDRSSASASEYVAYTLKHFDKATIIGERSRGAAYSNRRIPIDDAFCVSVSVSYPIHPITRSNWEGVGVKPDIETNADDALLKAHLLAIDNIKACSDEASYIKKLKIAKQFVQTKHQPAALPVRKLKQYEGNYGLRKLYVNEDNYLMYQKEKLAPSRLIPIDEEHFFNGQ